MMKEGDGTVEMQDDKAETHMKENQAKGEVFTLLRQAQRWEKKWNWDDEIARTSNMSEGCCLWDNENQ